MSGSRLVCAGCGWHADPGAARPYRCARAGDGGDHVLEHRLGPGAVLDRADDAHPFVRYRESLFAWHAAQARGVPDADFVALVRRLDARIAEVDGHGFAPTPYRRAAALGERLDVDLWIKDETGNVAGSHKARHLMGVLLHVEVEGIARDTPLAIASCGNAALAAAVLARAARRPLRVFVPPHAEPAVLDRLHALGAAVVACPRAPGELGDPCVRGFHAALAAGALPFCCQGNENGLTIDGGETLVHEMLAAGAPAPEHLVIQVGGGALASGCLQGVARARAAGRLARAPRVHTVQTGGAAPLARAWARFEAHRASGRVPLDAALAFAAAHRDEFMWPWETPPASVAEGILDDETYDWLALVRGMAATGGSAAVVDEDTLLDANRLARDLAGIPASATGSAGLAGAMKLRRDGAIAPGARVAVVLSGVERAGAAPA